jgi:hypothetical protein
MTAMISLLILGAVPSTVKMVGIALALIAAFLLAVEPEEAGSHSVSVHP